MEDYISLNKKNTELLIKKGVNDPARYDRLKENRYSIQVEMFSKYINKNAAILDIGIREGAFIEFLKEKGFNNLYGIDIYEKSIELAKEKGINCEVANAQEFSLAKQFDLIVMSHVLEHCPDPASVLDCVYTHLNIDGILFIEVPIEKGEPRPTEKDAHYFNFNSFDDMINLLGSRWDILEKFVSKKRIKVVLRRV